MQKLSRLFLLGVLTVLGIALLSRGTTPGVETAERRSAVGAFAPGVPVNNSGKPHTYIPSTPGEIREVVSSPSVVDFSQAVIDTSRENSIMDQYLRGEIDLSYAESGLSEAERAPTHPRCTCPPC